MDQFPAGLAQSADNAKTNNLRAVAIGDQHVLDLGAGYRLDAGLWDPDNHTPTRLEQIPHVTLRLAIERDGVVVPYAPDPDTRRAWALSEIQVARHRVSDTPVAPAQRAAAGQVLARIGDDGSGTCRWCCWRC